MPVKSSSDKNSAKRRQRIAQIRSSRRGKIWNRSSRIWMHNLLNKKETYTICGGRIVNNTWQWFPWCAELHWGAVGRPNNINKRTLSLIREEISRGIKYNTGGRFKSQWHYKHILRFVGIGFQFQMTGIMQQTNPPCLEYQCSIFRLFYSPEKPKTVVWHHVNFLLFGFPGIAVFRK